MAKTVEARLAALGKQDRSTIVQKQTAKRKPTRAVSTLRSKVRRNRRRPGDRSFREGELRALHCLYSGDVEVQFYSKYSRAQKKFNLGLIRCIDALY